MGLNHKEHAMEIRGDMSRNNLNLMLIKNITNDGEQTRLLAGADAEMGVATTDI